MYKASPSVSLPLDQVPEAAQSENGSTTRKRTCWVGRPSQTEPSENDQTYGPRATRYLMPEDVDCNTCRSNADLGDLGLRVLNPQMRDRKPQAGSRLAKNHLFYVQVEAAEVARNSQRNDVGQHLTFCNHLYIPHTYIHKASDIVFTIMADKIKAQVCVCCRSCRIFCLNLRLSRQVLVAVFFAILVGFTLISF